MPEVGYAVLPVIPSIRGIRGELTRQMRPAGVIAGRQFSGGMNSTLSRDAAASGKKASGSLAGAFLGGMKSVAGPLAALFAVQKVTSFFKDANAEARESQKVGAVTQQIIKATGGAAKITAGQVGELATAISNKTGKDDEAIQKGANLLLCLEESAEALTRDGWKTHDQLAVGDEILAYDPGDGSARWEPISDFFRYQVDTQLIRWKSKQIDIATTPHHRWWTEGLDGSAGFMVTEEINRHAHRVRIGGGSPEGFAQNETLDNDLVELLGWVATEGFYRGYIDQTGRRRVGARLCAVCSVEPARNAAGPGRCDACAGKPIQAGRTSPRVRVTAETSRAFTVGFSQSETANPLKVARIREMVGRLRARGYRINETRLTGYYNGSTMIQWAFSGELARTVRDLLPAKMLTPALFLSLTAKQAALLLDTLIEGDGNTDTHGHKQYIQKDVGQLDAIAMLCAMLGQRTTVLGRGDSIYLNGSDFLRGDNTHAELEDYSGVVWCPQIRTQIFLARNRGKTFWTGNTFKAVRNEAGAGSRIFDRATQAAVDLSATGFGSIEGSSKMLGKALQDPVKGISALSRAGVTFTDQQKEQIKTLVKSGDALGAQKLIMKEVESQVGGVAAASATAGEKMSVAFGNLKEQVGTALLPLLDKTEVVVTTKLIPALSSTAKWLSAHVGPAFHTVQSSIAPLVGRVKGFFTAIQSGQGSARFLRNQLVPAFLGVVGAGRRLGVVVLPIIRAIAGEFMRRWPQIRPLVIGIFRTVGGIVVDVMGLIRSTISTVTKVVSFIWSRWGKQITTLAGGTFKYVITVISGAMKVVGGIVKVITGVMTGDWSKAGAGIRLIVTGLKSMIGAQFTLMKTTVTTLLGGLITSAIGKFRSFLAWTSGTFRAGLAKVKDFVLSPVRAALDLLSGILGSIRDRFAGAVTNIGKAWDGLKAKARAPIAFVVNTVINDGLIRNFNKVANVIPGVSALPEVQFATGGVMPGYTPGRDVHRFYSPTAGYLDLSGGEPVMRPEFGRVVGSSWVDAANAAARSGGTGGVRRFLGGFASGGLVSFQGGTFTEQFASRLRSVASRIPFNVFQGGFRPATSYSGTSHRADAVDVGPVSALLVRALRAIGIAAWDRTGMGNWAPHIHGVPLPGAGLAGGSAVWQAQDYLRGGNGLGGRDNGAGSGGPLGVVGKIGAFIKSGFASAIDWFKNLIAGPLEKLSSITGSPLGQLTAGLPNMLADRMGARFSGFGNGTLSASPGWHWTGENGRELVQFGGGERVLPNRQAERLAGGEPREMRISGTLDLGGGLVGFVRGVVEQETTAAAGAF